MHVRAPHGRVAFGFGILRAVGPAGSTVVSPTTSTAASLPGEEEAAAAGGGEAAAAAGGGDRDPLLRRRSTAGVLLLTSRRGGSYPVDAWPSRRWPRSESVSPGCAARPDRRVVHTYSQCAVPGPGRGPARLFHLVSFLRTTTRGGLCSLRRAHRWYAAGRYVSVTFRAITRAGLCSLCRARRGYATGRYVSVTSRVITRAGLCSLRRARWGYAAGRYVSVTSRAITRAGLCSLRRAHRGYAAGWYVSVYPSQSESQRVVGSGRVSPAMCECARQGQWPGPALVGKAVTASQCRGRAPESAATGHEWPHAEGATVGTVLEPFMRSAHVLVKWATPRDPARGRGQAGPQTRAPSSPVCGPASIFRFYCRPPLSLLFFRCTLKAVFKLIDNAAEPTPAWQNRCFSARRGSGNIQSKHKWSSLRHLCTNCRPQKPSRGRPEDWNAV
jgi:hypothetical protein